MSPGQNPPWGESGMEPGQNHSWGNSGLEPGQSSDSCDENYSLAAFKRPRLDSTGGVAPQDSSPWPYNIDRNKPIGIAQPFQKQESFEIERLDDVSKDDPMLIKAKMFQDNLNTEVGKGGGGDGGGGGGGGGRTREVGGGGEITTGFNKEDFSADIKSKTRKNVLSSVDSDTDTTSTFDFPLEPPSDLPDDDNSSNGSSSADMHVVVPPPPPPTTSISEDFVAVTSREESFTQQVERDYGERDNQRLLKNTETERRKYALPLPNGKKFHVFLTHSTSDQDWAESCIVSPLSSMWRVRACYQLMPDTTRYDDREIVACMTQSCVIIIGLSPSYLKSGRYDIYTNGVGPLTLYSKYIRPESPIQISGIM